MAETQNIYDYYRRRIGSIETDNYGNKTARDFFGRIVGRYKKQQDITTDFFGTILTRGDTVASTIPPWDQQK
ncbi:MAG: hypothetical protein IJL66_04955 [Lachnospiraceae bacterium]|nr:hypothetical protein [Lachnospiraceae bacterium]